MDTEYGGLQISFQYGQCFAYAKLVSAYPSKFVSCDWCMPRDIPSQHVHHWRHVFQEDCNEPI